MADGSAACVCVLFYGSDDYCFKLAQRVLNEPMRELAARDVDFRFGLNAVGERTRQFVHRQAALFFKNAYIFDSPQNILKYPMMRQLFAAREIAAPFVVWFDDDSCFAPDTCTSNWLSRLTAQMRVCDLAGSFRRARLVGGQAEWIKAQSWYAGKEPIPYVQFVSGSWWAASTEMLRRFDWPPADMRQKGADVMLGELCRQHDLPISHFRDGVWINANDAGVEAAASRRQIEGAAVGADYLA